jgi:hypothetical protein
VAIRSWEMVLSINSNGTPSICQCKWFLARCGNLPIN